MRTLLAIAGACCLGLYFLLAGAFDLIQAESNAGLARLETSVEAISQ